MSDDEQYNLFDSRAERDEGMLRAGVRAGDYVPDGLALIGRLPNGTMVTGEDIYRKCQEAEIVPPDPHAHGTLIRIAIERGLLRLTGKYSQMRKVSSHARETRLYRVHSSVGEPPLPPKPPPEPPLTNAKFDETGMLVHKCAVCGSTKAPHGVDVNLRLGRLGVWFCEEHKPRP